MEAIWVFAALSRDSEEASIKLLRGILQREHLPYKIADLPALGR